MPLTQLFSRFNAFNAFIFPVQCFIAANFSFQRRQRRRLSSSTLIAPLLLQFNAVNAAILPVQRR